MYFILLIFFSFFHSVQLTTESWASESSCPIPLTLASWNTKHLGRKNFDYDKAVLLLQEFDVITLQEVNITPSGSEALTLLKKKLIEKTKERWCSALSPIPSDSIERYAYLWKNKNVTLVRSQHHLGHQLANLNEASMGPADCPDEHLPVDLENYRAEEIIREPAVAQFKHRQYASMFRFFSVHLVPSKKNPENEVPYLFDYSLDELVKEKIPFIVAGDFNLSADDEVFMDILEIGWQAILAGRQKTSLKRKSRELSDAYDNFWVFFQGFKKNHCQRKFGIKNIYEIFYFLPIEEIYRNLSDHTPIYMQFYEF